jgi:hypothetical protein
MTMKLLLTNHTYDDLGLRMGGVFLFALSCAANIRRRPTGSK